MFIKPTSEEPTAVLDRIGTVSHVSCVALAINAQPVFTKLVTHGYVSFGWGPSPIIISFRDELELGGGVFSLLINNSAEPEDFFKFYVQVFEMLGTYFMQDGKIISVREYRSSLGKGN